MHILKVDIWDTLDRKNITGISILFQIDFPINQLDF